MNYLLYLERRALRWFNILRLVNMKTNFYSFIISPLLIAEAFFLGLIFNYATIKLYAHITMPTFLVFPFAGMVLNSLEMGLLPPAARMHTLSEDFRREWGALGGKRMSARCCRSLRMEIGPF